MNLSGEVLSLSGLCAEVRNRIDWEAVEESIGVPLPSDYRWLLERVPPCAVQGAIYLWPPRHVEGVGWNYLIPFEGNLWASRMERSYYPDHVPFPLYPEDGYLIPWGTTIRGCTQYLEQTGPDPDDWTVVLVNGNNDRWERFDGSISEFLLALMRHEVVTDVLLPTPDPGPPIISFIEN